MKYPKYVVLFVIVFVFLFVFWSGSVYAGEDPCNTTIFFSGRELLKPFEFYVKSVLKEDLKVLALGNKKLCDVMERVKRAPYLEKEYKPSVIASYIVLYTIEDLAYVFITEEKEIKPVFKSAYEVLFKGKDPNYLAFSYKDGYVDENEKVYKNVALIKSIGDGKAVIVSRKGTVLEVEDFRFLAPGDHFYYTPFNPITEEFNKLKVPISKVRYIIFSPYR